MKMITPCCGAGFSVDLEDRGPAYMTYSVAVAVECDNCYCTYDLSGDPIYPCANHA